ncbi:unnamed protein product [Lota lota]
MTFVKVQLVPEEPAALCWAGDGICQSQLNNNLGRGDHLSTLSSSGRDTPSTTPPCHRHGNQASRDEASGWPSGEQIALPLIG